MKNQLFVLFALTVSAVSLTGVAQACDTTEEVENSELCHEELTQSFLQRFQVVVQVLGAIDGVPANPDLIHGFKFDEKDGKSFSYDYSEGFRSDGSFESMGPVAITNIAIDEKRGRISADSTENNFKHVRISGKIISREPFDAIENCREQIKFLSAQEIDSMFADIRKIRRGEKGDAPSFLWNLIDTGTTGERTNQEFIAGLAAKDLTRIQRTLEADADANLLIADSTEFPGATPIIMAAFTEDRDIVKLLLEHGAYVNATIGGSSSARANTAGFSALLAAVSNNNPDLVQMLIAAGADVNYQIPADTPETGGLTALKIAKSKRHKQIAKMLKKEMKRIKKEKKKR